jgi:hypothetical protein
VSDDLQHIVPAEQHAAAGRAVAVDLAGGQPSIDCPYIDAAQPGDLPFRQQFLLAGVFRRHDPSLPAPRLIFLRRAGAKRTPRAVSGTSRPVHLFRELDGRGLNLHWRESNVCRTASAATSRLMFQMKHAAGHGIWQLTRVRRTVNGGNAAVLQISDETWPVGTEIAG